jgi:hypothetical protein
MFIFVQFQTCDKETRKKGTGEIWHGANIKAGKEH